MINTIFGCYNNELKNWKNIMNTYQIQMNEYKYQLYKLQRYFSFLLSHAKNEKLQLYINHVNIQMHFLRLDIRHQVKNLSISNRDSILINEEAIVDHQHLIRQKMLLIEKNFLTIRNAINAFN